MLSLYHCSPRHNARGKSRALEGSHFRSKSRLSVQDGGVGVAVRNGREKSVSPTREAMNEVSRGPSKDAVSAQKAHQGSETDTKELLGGTEEKSGP